MKVTTTARAGAACIAGMVAISLAALPAVAATASSPAVTYSFRKLDNPRDRSFNQLLGINNRGKIVGFFGSGAPGHPSRGYRLTLPHGRPVYRAENFPGSAQTEVFGINDNGVTVGLFSRTTLINSAGFYRQNGRYHKVRFPTTNPSSDELLGINNSGVAVGAFADSAGNMHGFRLNINNHRFTRINIANASSVTATAINAGGTVAGFFTNKAGKIAGFLRRASGQVVTFAKAGADMTQAYGINKGGLVVGAYTIGNRTFGFTWSRGHFRTVNDPNGVGTTVITGINNAGDLVGFYTDRHGNTNGLLARP